MAKVLNVSVDPYLIALPESYNSEEKLEQFVEGILAWADAMKRDEIRVLISQVCVDALYEDEFYPYDYKLRKLLSTYSSEESITSEDICRVVSGLLDKTPYLEEFIGISEILYEDDKTEIEPKGFVSENRLKSNTAEALKKSLIMLGLWLQNSSISLQIEECFFATSIDETIGQHQKLSVVSEVSLVEPYDIKCDSSYEVPHIVDSSFPIYSGGADLLENVLGHPVQGVWCPQDKLLPCYITTEGKNLLAEWLDSLADFRAKEIIQARLSQVKRGTLGENRSLGEGVYELKIRYGPAYRIYFGFVTTTQILLLCGGDKSTQPEDIIRAKQIWKACKQQ